MADRYWLTMRGVLDLDWPDSYRSRRGGLSTHAAVLAAIAGYADADGYAWPKMTTLAEGLGVSDDTVSRTVEDLCDIGLLDRARLYVAANGNLANYIYRLPGARRVDDFGDLLPRGFKVAVEDVPDDWLVDADPAPTPGPGPRTGAGSKDPAPTPGQELTNKEVSNEEGSNGSAVAEDSPYPDIATDETIAWARQLCNVFAAYVKRNGHAIPTTETARDRWRVEMERLVRIGPPGDVEWPDDPDHAAVEIERVMVWALDVSDFWPANVQSVPTLRQKFTRLRAQANRDGGTAAKRGKYERLQREGLT